MKKWDLEKSFDVTVDESEIVDAQYLQKVLDERIVKDVPYFDLLDSDQLEKMINYMSENNFMITPGTYKLNQSWKFEDGLFKINNGKKQEIFKFKTK